MASTFYGQIAANKRNSVLLALAVVAAPGPARAAHRLGRRPAIPRAALPSMAIAIGVGLVASLASYFGGDSLVLASRARARSRPQEAPQLLNVVREMALAASVPMPRVYLIDDTAPNAFATGRDPQHASMAITTGLLEKLDREELQGVIAHELSHVRNFDIRFSLIVGVLVGSIALLADFFLRFTFWGGAGRRGRRERRTRAAVAAPGRDHGRRRSSSPSSRPIFARLVQLAVSRQREYLADASGVELTRNPYGLERALAKISLDTEPLEVANRATQHLYFDNPIKAARDARRSLFSTHPPILDRINRLRELTGQPPVAEPRWCSTRSAQAAALRSPGRRVAPVRPVRLPPVRATWYSPARRRAPAGTRDRAEIAQLVEHATENRGVASSNLALGTTPRSVIERKWLSW